MCEILFFPDVFIIAFRCSSSIGPGSIIANSFVPTINVPVPVKVKGPGFFAINLFTRGVI